MLDAIRDKAQSWAVKIIFLIIIVVFVFWGVGSFNSAGSGTAAVVNGESISLHDYNKALRAFGESERRNNPDIFKDEAVFRQFKSTVLSEMILSLLRRQEAERIGLRVSDYELKAYIDTFPVFHDAHGKFDAERYKTILAANNINPAEFESDNKKALLEGKLLRCLGLSASFAEAEIKQLFKFSLEKRKARYVLFNPGEYRDRVDIGEEAIAGWYENNKESLRKPLLISFDYLRLTPVLLSGNYMPQESEIEEFYKNSPEDFTRPASYTASHIYIAAPPEGSTEPDAAEKVADAAETAGKLRARLKAGEDFAKLAKEYSQDPETASAGGLLPPLEAGQSYAEEFDKAALALAPGQISDPVRTRYGFHIIRLENRTEAAVLPLDEVREDIRAALALEKAEADFPNVEKKVEDETAAGASLEDTAAVFKLAPEKRAMVNLEEAVTALSLREESRRAFEDAAATAAAGEAGSMLPVPLDIAGGIALVRISEAVPSRIPSIEEARTGIIAALRTEGANRLARAAAEQALPAFSGRELPEAFKDKAAESAPGLRVFPTLDPLGAVPDLVDGIFSSDGVWLPQVYDTPAGPVIAQTAGVETVKDEEWDQLKGIFVAQYRQSREEQTVQAFMQKLLNKASVRENPDALDQISLR
ncbi:MAG: SurA N-terminal domain-containing protein [Desulfovibrio sp.]|jgi:peptidyl-prolyl cis-trans isomerase D|nr:SurA N-terminal domain-containing protein [Desulfovibrio sp.]